MEEVVTKNHLPNYKSASTGRKILPRGPIVRIAFSERMHWRRFLSLEFTSQRVLYTLKFPENM